VAYNNLGYIYNKLKRYDEAIAPLKKAIELDPKYAPAYYNLGAAYINTNNKTGAKEQYQILQPLDAALARLLLDLINK
jgi:superkiller protein 3